MSENFISEKIKSDFLRQQYRLVGRHSAVKICEWNKKAICGEAFCYKNDFYGIPSHRCVQMTPALTCNQRCQHCWRDTSLFSKNLPKPIDDPKEIIERCIEERKKLLIGFKGNKAVNKELLEDAFRPIHAAISLTGEPCLYPKLPQLIDEFYAQKFKTVFLVTNGTVPERLKKLHKMPTNLYISLEATNNEMHKELNLPVKKSYWKGINESLKVVSKLGKKTNTVARITCIKGLNMEKPEDFISLLEKGKFKYVEAKAYMFLGESRKRLQEKNMPLHKQVQEFAKALEENSDYRIKDEREDSRIVLLEKK